MLALLESMALKGAIRMECGSLLCGWLERWMVALKGAVMCTTNFLGGSDSDRLGSAGSEQVVGRADLR
jgi:hypothetical protein